MKKANIKPLVLSALSALAFGAVGTAGTFALFTDKAETTVQVQAGIVDVDATISDLAFYELGVTTPITETDSNGAYVNSIGGTAKINGSTLVLNKWAPGDKVTFKLTVKNKSNVDILTRLRETHSTTSSVDLYEALDITYTQVSGLDADKIFHWNTVGAVVNQTAGYDVVSVLNVTIEFPNHGDLITAREEGIDNHYQNSNCTIVLSQQAVQGNAEAVDLVSQWNKYLAESEGVNNSLTAAIAEVDGNEAQLKSERIVWKAAEDKFYYEEEVAAENRYQYFKAYDAMPTVQNWSVYATSSWTNNEVALKGIGFDVGGKAASITSVSYVGESAPRINRIYTNSASTSITINAPLDTVQHYGEAGFLNIIAVANSSYHEHGYIPQAQISKGRVVNEAGSVQVEGGLVKQSGVENLFIVAATEGSGTEAGTFNEIVVEAAEGASIPSLDRSDVNIVGEVLVLEVKTPESDDFVYLTKAGIIEQIVVTSEKGNIDTTSEKAAYGTDENLNEASSKAALEIANIAKRGENGRPVKEDGVTEMTVEEVAEIETIADIVIEEPKATLEDLSKTQGEDALYAGGVGSKTNPYVIPTEDWWMKFVDLCKDDNDFSETAGKYFKVLTDLDLTSKQVRANIHYFAGSIDFDNHVFTGLTPVNAPEGDVGDDGITAIFSLIHGEVSISNLRFVTTKIVNGSHTVAAQVAGINSGNVDVTYENITMSGSVTGTTINNNGLLLSYILYGTANITIKNVDNYANLIGTGYKSVYLGNMGTYGNVLTIDISGCDNFGTIVSTNKEAAMFISNPGYLNHDVIVTLANCSNQGNICQHSSYSRNNLFTTRIDSNYRYIVNGMNLSQYSDADFNDRIASAEALTGGLVNSISSSTLATNDGAFVLTPVTDAVRYELSFSFSAGGMAAGGGAGYTMKMTPEQLAEAHVKVYDWIEKAEATDPIVEHTEYVNPYYTSGEHYVFNADNMTIRDDVLVTLIAYDANDALLSIATYTYAS